LLFQTGVQESKPGVQESKPGTLTATFQIKFQFQIKKRCLFVIKNY